MIKKFRLLDLQSAKKVVLFSLFVVLFIICFSPEIYSQGIRTVNLETAKSVATKYCLETDSKYATTPGREFTLSLAETKTAGKNVLYYVFNINSEDGFIIISADINTKPVLCYVSHGQYSIYPDSRPPAFNEWLATFAYQIEYSLTHDLKIPESQSLWNSYLAKGKLDAETMVLKLTSKWNQTAYFNAYSPTTGVDGHPIESGGSYANRTPTGCVATAMGQIINYYKWPLSGSGTYSYTDPSNPNVNSSCGSSDPGYGLLGFINHTQPYDYSLMVNTPTSINTEISRLLYNCGVSVDMDFAYCQSWTNTSKAKDALKNYFGYNPTITYIKRSDYPDTWESIIIDQIRKERPVQYRGQADVGVVGHSWVCYGYKTVAGSTQFMFNWGFGGNYDDFFSLTSTSYPMGSLTSENAIVINIFPTDQPNLTIPTASVTADPIFTLVPFTLNFTISNTGTREATASTAACYLSSDNILDKNDIFITTINISSLTPAQSTPYIVNTIISEVPQGTYYILIEPDTDHEVHESDEFDNIKAIQVNVQSYPVQSGDYRSASTGNWSDLATWLYYDGSDWVAAVTVPSSSSGNISIRSPHIVTVSNSMSVDQVTINSGGQLNVDAGFVLTIENGSDDIDFSVHGTLVNSGTITSIGNLSFNPGSTYVHAQDGGTIPVATWAVTSNCSIIGIINSAPAIPALTQPFGNFTYDCTGQTANFITLAGTLNHIAGNLLISSTGSGNNDLRLGQSTAGDLIVNGNFTQTGGTFLITGNDLGSASTRKMTIDKNLNLIDGIFAISYANGAATLDVGGDLSTTGTFYFAFSNSIPAILNVAGNLSITGGVVNISNSSAAGTLNLKGNFLHTGGLITETSTGSGAIFFNGTSMQTYTSGGTIENTVNFTVNNGAYLQMESPSAFISGGGTFTLSAGSTLGINSPDGITGEPATATGNIRTTAGRVFNAGANYLYNGIGSQVCGSGLPSTVNSLSVTGTSDLGLTVSPLTITNTLTIGSGANLSIGALQRVTTKDFVYSGTMVIGSTALNNNGSFIATRTLTQNGGSVTYNRQLRVESNFGDRHYLSSPVGGNTETNSGKITGTWQWNEAIPSWSLQSITALESGRGYNLDQTTASDGLISFTGSLVNSTTISATSPYKSGYTDRSTPAAYGVGNETADIWAPGRSWTNYGAGGWNLLGNPFTSAMNSATFISTNSTSFDPNYLALYIYDGTTGQYKYSAASLPGFPSGLSSFGDNIQVGQGFFVLAINNGIGFTFNSAMQVHNTTVSMTKSGNAGSMEKAVTSPDPWPGLQLKVKYGDKEGQTIIVYNERMSAALDPGYDVGQFSSGPAVEVYTRMVSESNGVNFARQALPVSGCEKAIVPVGIDSEKGGEVTFSAYTVPLDNFKFKLEDRLTGTFTDLETGTYTVTIPEKTYGTGRFFIHASGNTLTEIQQKPLNPDLQNIKIWFGFNNVIIEGAVSNKAIADVFDLQGRKILGTRLSEGSYNSFPLPSAANGFYVVKITDGPKVVMKKIVVL